MYPGENVDFYDEYVQRHAPVVINWFEERKASRYAEPLEAMGVGCLKDESGTVQCVAAPMEDGSLCMWNTSDATSRGQEGCIFARSQPGLLSVMPNEHGRLESITNETGAIENVSMDSKQHKGYFAVHDTLTEVDMNTLSIIHRRKFAFPVSCISAAEPSVPLTVGTSHTMHLFGVSVRRLLSHHT